MVSWVVPLASFVDAAVSDEERGIIVTDEFADLVIELGVDVFHFTVFVDEELAPVRSHVVLVVWTVPLDKLLISVDAGLASVDFELVEDMLVELLDVEVVLVLVDMVLVLVVLVGRRRELVLVLVDVCTAEWVVLVDEVLVLEVLVEKVLELVVLVDVVLVFVVSIDVVLVLLVLVDLFFVLAISKACAGLLNCSSPLPATPVPATVLQAPPSTGQSCTRCPEYSAIKNSPLTVIDT